MKVLINTPDFSFSGGVANHYKGLQPHWNVEVSHNFIGGRKGIPGAIVLIPDVIKFFFICLLGRYDVILLNPSLGRTAVKRDALFLRIAKWFNRKTVVFFHGWSNEMVREYNKNSEPFVRKFSRADRFIVLSQSFKEDMTRWGIEKPIELTTTKVNNQFIDDFSVVAKDFTSENLLFLSRVETYKGIYITLEAFIKVKEKHPECRLTIAGGGTELENAKAYVREKNIEDVFFLGSIAGDELIQTYSRGTLYIFPSYSEGMPTTVLEAMAFGCPIITRPVGGLKDFFEEGKMGYSIDSFNAEEFAEKIMELMRSSDKMKEIGCYNHEYAKNHFLASEVTKKLEEILLR